MYTVSRGGLWRACGVATSAWNCRWTVVCVCFYLGGLFDRRKALGLGFGCLLDIDFEKGLRSALVVSATG